jgi:hypothetical protein
MTVNDDADEAAKIEKANATPDKVVSKKPCAKDVSFWGQILAGLWIATMTVLKGMNLINLEIDDIIYSAIAMVGVFSPVYISVWLEKLRDIRFGK